MGKRSGRLSLELIDTPESIEQLERIDKLREAGVGEQINLPQLVVVGDQSSGKSSLLEGLTGLPFPVASELCTRFATQIVFRRLSGARKVVTTVSIIGSIYSDEDHKKQLSKFSRTLKGELDADTFQEVLNDAAVCMGLPGKEDSIENATKRFSDDVLKIEIAGPDQSHLSFCDVPGLFHNPTKYQTEEDAAIIKRLIETYVADERTVIMAVMDSRNNLANQEVFRIAKNADPKGLRTVGIMTKLDALQEGDEGAALQIAQNQVARLTHGWYCVRNRSTQEINAGVTIEERHKNEKTFFESAPFKILDKNRVGVPSLKKALAKILNNLVAGEFPAILREIEVKEKERRGELLALGPPRETPHQQTQFLLSTAGSYQRNINDALMGRYDAQGDGPTKLRMHVTRAGVEFSKKMELSGHTWNFSSTDQSLDEAEKAEKQQTSQKGIFPKVESKADPGSIYLSIKNLWSSSRGRELPGLVNPAVLEILFREQTTRWQVIAEEHLINVISMIEKCHRALFEDSCQDVSVRKRLASKIATDFSSSIDGSREVLATLLRDERDGPLLTNNHYFADNLAAARAERVVSALKKLGYQDGQQYTMNFKSLTTVSHLSNDASAVHDIHDILKAYYRVALKRFVDNVALQVIERCLLGPQGPLLGVFNSEYVGKMEAADLAFVAGEDSFAVGQREDLQVEIKTLENARRICSGACA